MFVSLSITKRIFASSVLVGPFPGPLRGKSCLNTIAAPYSHRNVAFFGSNAHQQCMAMSFFVLIYNYTNTINTKSDSRKTINQFNVKQRCLTKLRTIPMTLMASAPKMKKKSPRASPDIIAFQRLLFMVV